MNREELMNLLNECNASIENMAGAFKNAFGEGKSAEDIKNLQDKLVNLKAAKESLENQIKEFDAKVADKAKMNGGVQGMDKDKLIEAKAELVRAALDRRPMNAEMAKIFNEGAGGTFTMDGGTHWTDGQKFLPSTMSNELLYEPLAKNPLRELSRFTTITNLELPKISFSVSAAGTAGATGALEATGVGMPGFLTTDSETAKEIKSASALIKFRSNKFKAMVVIPETVFRGSAVDLMGVVNSGLASAFAKQEKELAFAKDKYAESTEDAAAPKSFYAEIGSAEYGNTANSKAIKEVKGASLYEAIINAYADLEDDYADNATVLMRKPDYFSMIKELVNGSAVLFGAKPADILGVDVKYCEKAAEPIVGDFNYSHYNYDLGMEYDSDKDILTGNRRFVVTAYVDHRITMKSAFRLAKVGE